MLAEVWVPSHVYEAIDGSVGWGKGEVDVQQFPAATSKLMTEAPKRQEISLSEITEDLKDSLFCKLREVFCTCVS